MSQVSQVPQGLMVYVQATEITRLFMAVRPYSSAITTTHLQKNKLRGEKDCCQGVRCRTSKTIIRIKQIGSLVYNNDAVDKLKN